jgi:phospholipase C
MSPIAHVVIITKENHTFDNYFGAFPGVTGVSLPHAIDPHPDQGHGHDAWLKSHGASGVTGSAKTQYTAADIPAYWAFAQQYTLCDNYFTDVASQSEPNQIRRRPASAASARADDYHYHGEARPVPDRPEPLPAHSGP